MHEYAGYARSYKYVDPNGLDFPVGEQSGPFADWNNQGTVEFANCYCFAANTRPNWKKIYEGREKKPEMFVVHMPEPGGNGGAPIDKVTPESLRTAFVADGFVLLDCAEGERLEVPEKGYLLAVYCAEERPKEETDFHVYRYGPDNTWHHKRGWFRSVMNIDYWGNTIVEIEEAARGQYEVFVGFFYSPEDRKPLNIIIEDRKGNLLSGERPVEPPRRLEQNRANTKSLNL